MPTYCFRNRKGDLVEISMPMSRLDKRSRKDGSIIHKGQVLRRDKAAEMGVGPTGDHPGWPRESSAMMVLPDQIPEAERNWERMGVPLKFNPKTGRAVIESVGHQRRVLKTIGWRNWDSYD